MDAFEPVRSLWTNAAADRWSAEWPLSASHFPNAWTRPPDDAAWAALIGKVRLRPDVRMACLQAAAQLRDVPALWRLFRHCHWCLFARDDYARKDTAAWPMIPAAAHAGAPLFYALVLLAGIPAVLSRNRGRGIPDAVTFETLEDLDRWILVQPALPTGWLFENLDWFWNHFQCRLFSLGRLQFCIEPLTLPTRGFRNRRTGAVCLLAPGAARVGRDGRYEDIEQDANPNGFLTVFEETPQCIQGHPIDADGCVKPSPVALDPQLWEPLCATNGPAISVHIPAGSPLDPDACLASFRRATPFFRNHFPDTSFPVYFTDSWLLDPALARILPETANIVRFQGFFHRVPLLQATDRQLWERVFDAPSGRPANPPCRTSLQRAILEHLRQGGRFRNGGGIRLPDAP